MKVLVVEDDDYIREGLEEILQNEGYQTVPARDGREAIALFQRESPEFVCLDIMMPGLDGYEVCRQIRQHHPEIPIIFISAKSEEIDKVVGLELGADDFIMKPFGVREVIARIRAVTRRYLASRQSSPSSSSFQLRDLTVSPEEMKARRGQKTVELSLREVRILQLLYQRRGKVLNRDTFFNVCWGIDYCPDSRTLDQCISQLRKKIEKNPRKPEIIQTVHGVGYRYVEGVDKKSQ